MAPSGAQWPFKGAQWRPVAPSAVLAGAQAPQRLQRSSAARIGSFGAQKGLRRTNFRIFLGTQKNKKNHQNRPKSTS